MNHCLLTPAFRVCSHFIFRFSRFPDLLPRGVGNREIGKSGKKRAPGASGKACMALPPLCSHHGSVCVDSFLFVRLFTTPPRWEIGKSGKTGKRKKELRSHLYTGFYGSKKLYLTKVAILASLVIFHRQEELGIMLERLKNKWSSRPEVCRSPVYFGKHYV